MDYKADAYSGEDFSSPSHLRNRADPVKTVNQEVGTGYFVLSARQFQKFTQCMENPPQPTEAMRRVTAQYEEMLKKRNT